MRKSTVILLFGVAILLLAACSAAPEPTPYPTYTPYPEPTPYPTYTPYPEPTPYPTYTPYPEPTPYPTYTPYPETEAAMPDLTDLFCAYDFCIGHPSGAYLTDVDAPDAWNDYDFGVLIGINTAGSWMAVDWERVGRSEWRIEEQALDAANALGEAQGEVRMEEVGGFDVAVVASYDESDDTLPYGSAAAWYCGGRGFRASVFNKNQSLPEVLLLEAIERFTCGN